MSVNCREVSGFLSWNAMTRLQNIELYNDSQQLVKVLV